MKPENGINLSQVNYFNVEEYINNIKLEKYLLEHIEETNKKFEKYINCLLQFSNYSIIYYWIDSLNKEIYSSQKIENHENNMTLFLNDDVFFDTLSISHSRIKKIHKVATNDINIKDYRKRDVRVSSISISGKETIYWRGAVWQDLKKFMDDFIKIYKSNTCSIIDSNPYIKSALVHLIFVRIHPFLDGNGRTARMIHNIKFTEVINKIYGTKLKICPLNISQNILYNKLTYADRINDIYFDLEHDCNDEINRWFDFILNMVDEQLYFNEHRIYKFENALKNIDKFKILEDQKILKKISNMNLKKMY